VKCFTPGLATGLHFRFKAGKNYQANECISHYIQKRYIFLTIRDIVHDMEYFALSNLQFSTGLNLSL